MSITVDSRTRDPKSEQVVKYVNEHGTPIQYIPVRKISPNTAALTPIARFIADRAEGKYIGGMLLRGFLVRVEGAVGSQHAIEVKKHGQERAEKLAHIWGLNKNERATIHGWLFPVFEPEMDETEFLNAEAKKMVAAAGVGGRIIINNEIMEVTHD
jgi:hypothetical protein